MFSHEELREIAKMGGNGTGYVSLYLNVNPATNPGGEYAIWVKNAIKELQDTTDKELLKSVAQDLKEIEAHIQANKKIFKKGLVILTSRGNSFWREYNVSVPLKNLLVVDRTPHIKPLLDMLERYKRHAVLLVDKEEARIFVIHMGEMTEYGEMQTEGVPGKHKKGGWFALAQNHYDRHIEQHVRLHLKDALKQFAPFLKGESISMLFLGGSEEAVLKTKALLPRELQEKVIGTFHADMFDGTLDILKKVQPILSAHEIETESGTVKDLIARAMKNEKAVIGLEPVLASLQEGRIHRLVLERDATAFGLKCTACGALTEQETGPQCPYCGGKMESVQYLVDLAAQKAVEQGAEVLVVPESKDLRKSGSIGAFLRF